MRLPNGMVKLPGVPEKTLMVVNETKVSGMSVDEAFVPSIAHGPLESIVSDVENYRALGAVTITSRRKRDSRIYQENGAERDVIWQRTVFDVYGSFGNCTIAEEYRNTTDEGSRQLEEQMLSNALLVNGLRLVNSEEKNQSDPGYVFFTGDLYVKKR